MEERRAEERIPITIEIKHGLTIPYFPGHTLNVSENGIAVESQIVFPRKHRVVIDLYTGSEIIRLDGLVIWTLSTPSSFIYRMGIKFTSRADAFKNLQHSLNPLEKDILTLDE